MVVTDEHTLNDLKSLIDPLLAVVQQKISSNLVTQLNERFDNKLKINYVVLNTLLHSIDCKIRKSEILYLTFLREVNHDVLCSSPFPESLLVRKTFTFSTSTMISTFEIDDRDMYVELIEMNFQSFILTISSVLDNIVKLKDILIAKVLIHKKNGSTFLATPLDLYLDYFESLLELKYRQKDSLFHILDKHKTFCNDYLDTIKNLRNRYIHGSSTLLEPRNGRFIIIDPNIGTDSPQAAVDVFAGNTLDNIKLFIVDLFTMLQAVISDPVQTLPIP
ncbi:MAG: hypothetical protein ABUT20_40800 [Bacteroidota bacterium]